MEEVGVGVDQYSKQMCVQTSTLCRCGNKYFILLVALFSSLTPTEQYLEISFKMKEHQCGCAAKLAVVPMDGWMNGWMDG